ncbi:MAG TPA: exodeoxyribonuclease VII small subunit [Patescibacteria group bacterium]|nr:exodeoxyribonuclease VII small subunit [Patescibacteria group bacterium]
MTKNIDYRELSGQLDEILAQLQLGDLDVDEATKLYEKGMLIVSDLEQYLKTAENKVIKLKKAFEK